MNFRPFLARCVIAEMKVSVRPLLLVSSLLIALGSSSCMQSDGVASTDQDNLDWRGVGLDATEQRFSQATKIDTQNVAQMGLAWWLELPGEAGLEATPLAVDGVLYFTGGLGVVYAVDAVSGKRLWTYDPEAGPRMTVKVALMYPVNRGLAYDGGKLYLATRDGRMIAIDAKTGKPDWTTPFFLPNDRSTSTGAPRIAGDLVLIGNSGAESNARGYITAFDAKTGKIAWRFFTVPPAPGEKPENSAMEMAAKTWPKDGTKYGGGGTVWNSIVYDKKFDQILIGTGNGSPYLGKARGTDQGMDNLFLDSLVAVDAKTGKYKWHYQHTPGEVWDYKSTADIILADLKIDGKDRSVAMQAPSNGFFYVVDRSDGKLISAEKYAKVTWAERIDLKTGRPIEIPGARYEKAPAIIYPGSFGGHNWQAMSFNPQTGLVYFPSTQFGVKFYHDANEEAALPKKQSSLMNLGVFYDPYVDPKDPHDGKGALIAWDPVKQKAVWTNWQESFFNGGTVTTAGNLVFQGDAKGQIAAYDATNGKKLWSFDAQMGIMAAPISFTVKGKQYVSVLAGYGGGGTDGLATDKAVWSYYAPRRLLTFAIGGTAKLPPQTVPRSLAKTEIVDVQGQQLDPKMAAKGEYIWYFSCIACHGNRAEARGGAPDLRASAAAADLNTFKAILKQNVLVSRGMPRFDDLSDTDMENLYQYIRVSARQAKAGK